MKTRIFYEPNVGWYDIDDDQTFYKTRSLARIARRNRNSKVTSQKFKLTSVTTVVPMKPGQTTTLASLQQRLFERMTKQQGLSDQEAIDVILNRGYGYNMAASYGHMRHAGATDLEADIVLNYKNPTLSRYYGQGRANGGSHYNSLKDAYVALSKAHSH